MAARLPENWREEMGGAGALVWMIRGSRAGNFVNVIGTPEEIEEAVTAGDCQMANRYAAHQFAPATPGVPPVVIEEPEVNPSPPPPEPPGAEGDEGEEEGDDDTQDGGGEPQPLSAMAAHCRAAGQGG